VEINPDTNKMIVIGPLEADKTTKFKFHDRSKNI